MPREREAAGHRALHGTPEDLAPDPAPEPTRDLPHPALAADPDAALRERLSRTTYHDPGAREERERAAAEARPDGPPPPSIAFRPRTGARRLATVLLLLGLAATALAGWQAYETRMDTDYGLTAILALFTGIVWAVRTGSRPTRLTLHGGRLTVDTPGERQVFDLHDHAVHVEMVGEPGRRGWKVLLRRGSRAPYVLTSALVDPWDLTEALRYHRPDL